MAEVLGHLEPKLSEGLLEEEGLVAQDTLQQCAGVFKHPGEVMGRTDWAQCTIIVNWSSPIRQRLQKVPIHGTAQGEAKFNRMLPDKLIKPTIRVIG